eukprot:14857099-Alexandrium_andersonii.AAC.1
MMTKGDFSMQFRAWTKQKPLRTNHYKAQNITRNRPGTAAGATVRCQKAEPRHSLCARPRTR